jgi:REP element-mobilizing transposase RayT
MNTYYKRKSMRLACYDYRQSGLYFITICGQNRLKYFGEIEEGRLILNDAGKMVEEVWFQLDKRFPSIIFHECVVMPNHFHAIIEIDLEMNGLKMNGLVQPREFRATTRVSPTDANMVLGSNVGVRPCGYPHLGDIIGAFKSITTHKYIKGVREERYISFEKRLWQRNYYEHIVRNEKSYLTLSEYILNNPSRWNEDIFYET